MAKKRKKTFKFHWKSATAKIAAGLALIAIGYFMHPLVNSCSRKTEKHDIPYSKYNSMFTDGQDLQIKAAKKVGVKPKKNRDYNFSADKELTNVRELSQIEVDKLDYSVPYLTNEAAQLLADIGQNFTDKLTEKGYRPHKIIVTSVLRTEEDIKKLQKVNGNAVKNSTHAYATTFDITYDRFQRVSTKGDIAYNDVLIETLADVLKEMQNDGRCYVKFERNQHCFHITSRK